MMVVVDGSSGAGGWMNTVAVVRVDRRAVVVVVRMDRAVRRMRMRITRVGEGRMRRVGMVSKGVHGMVRMTRMTRMTRMVRVVSVVNSMRMVTAVVVMVMMARMRAQVGSCGSGSGTVRQAEEVGQVLPPMFHAHRAHKRHAHLKKKINKREIIFTFDFSQTIRNERTTFAHALETLVSHLIRYKTKNQKDLTHYFHFDDYQIRKCEELPPFFHFFHLLTPLRDVTTYLSESTRHSRRDRAPSDRLT